MGIFSNFFYEIGVAFENNYSAFLCVTFLTAARSNFRYKTLRKGNKTNNLYPNELLITLRSSTTEAINSKQYDLTSTPKFSRQHSSSGFTRHHRQHLLQQQQQWLASSPKKRWIPWHFCTLALVVRYHHLHRQRRLHFSAVPVNIEPLQVQWLLRQGYRARRAMIYEPFALAVKMELNTTEGSTKAIAASLS